MKNDLKYAYLSRDRWFVTGTLESSRSEAHKAVIYTLDTPKIAVIRNLMVVREYMHSGNRWTIVPTIPYKVYLQNGPYGTCMFKNKDFIGKSISEDKPVGFPLDGRMKLANSAGDYIYSYIIQARAEIESRILSQINSDDYEITSG